MDAVIEVGRTMMEHPMGREFMLLVINSGNWVMQHPFEVSAGILTGAEATAVAWWQKRRAVIKQQALEGIPKVQGIGLNQPNVAPIGVVIDDGDTAKRYDQKRKKNRNKLPGQLPSDSPPNK